MEAIREFRGKYHFLSNFYGSPMEIEGKWYKSVEHAFQAFKTNDLVEREEIRLSGHPAEAKRLGRECTVREDWETFKYDWMYELLKKKFEDERFEQQLLLTGELFIEEGNTWHDNDWGNCYCESLPKCEPEGHNNLGILLMKLRNALTLPQENE